MDREETNYPQMMLKTLDSNKKITVWKAMIPFKDYIYNMNPGYAQYILSVEFVWYLEASSS